MKAFYLAPEKLSGEICLCTETLHKNFIMQAQNFNMRWVWGSIGNETSVNAVLQLHFIFMLKSTKCIQDDVDMYKSRDNIRI